MRRIQSRPHKPLPFPLLMGAMSMPSPVCYKVVLPCGMGCKPGDYVHAEVLVPIPYDATPYEMKMLRDFGINRLIELGAIVPVHEEE